MIAKRIDRNKDKVQYDNFRALALYVAGHTEKKPDEKILHTWIAGCGADDFFGALIEIECVQAINTRSKNDKSYHLMLSFRPEDEDKLTPKCMEEIEKKIALALGFEEHQRICGIHHNTSNIHFHIAYNTINQENYTKLDPYRDFFALAKACREIEQEYGLVVDPGLEPGRQNPSRTNVKAQTMEARSGEQSFDSYMQERRESLLTGLERCRNWHDLHGLLDSIGVFIALQNKGCVLKDKHGKHAVKGSSLARQFSLGNLEKRFGRFQPCAEQKHESVEHYTAKPLRGPVRGELFLEYRKGIDERKVLLEELAFTRKQRTYDIRMKWQRQREKIEKSIQLTRNDKYRLLTQFKAREATELSAVFDEAEKQKLELRKRVPYTNWVNFLQYKSNQGNELALQILRSKNIDESMEKINERKNLPHANTVFWKEKIADIAGNSGLNRNDRRVLIAVAKMQELQAQGLAGTEGLTHSIDSRGIIIFRLSSGGQVRNDGKKISFSAFDPAASQVAAKYAAVCFGKYRQDGNILTREQPREFQRPYPIDILSQPRR